MQQKRWSTYLRNNRVPHIPPLALHNLETPDLGSRPAVIDRLDPRRDPLGAAVLPALGQERVAHLQRARLPLGAALHFAEEPVAVLAVLVVEGAVLGRALDAARRRLLDVDVRQARVVRVLLGVEADGGEADGLAREPADALEREAGVDVAGERFVLWERGC